MNLSAFLRAAAGLALLGAVCCAAQEAGYWRAASSAASSITGDISIAQSKITIDFTAFPIVQVRTLTPAEVSAAFGVDLNAGGDGRLYKLTVPGARRFLHHNTLCGTEDTQWMATYVAGHTLKVTVFSGTEPPVLTLDALANSMDVCGTFMYSR
ncbi:MAG TPA: hypothetical protein VG893_01905 [Terracidiphilus sp.]|nr:hypothetical protein [Terracidiphilus sp.]